jgi:hypothetical protein
MTQQKIDTNELYKRMNKTIIETYRDPKTKQAALNNDQIIRACTMTIAYHLSAEHPKLIKKASSEIAQEIRDLTRQFSRAMTTAERAQFHQPQ